MSKRQLCAIGAALGVATAAVGTSLASAGGVSRAHRQSTPATESVTPLASSTTTTFFVSFSGPFEAHRIDVNTNGKSGTVTASSSDFCSNPNHWANQMINITKGNPPGGKVPAAKYAVSNGGAGTFSGAVSMSAPLVGGGDFRVLVTYALGVDDFPTCMTEKIVAPAGSTLTYEG